VGIDLGTTNCAIAYIDSERSSIAVQQLRIPQLTASGTVTELSTLPAFCYLTLPQEWPPNSLQLPWADSGDYFVGMLARQQGAKVPTRLVQSAKSWLCHSAANRREPILPFEAEERSLAISPVEAAIRYLRHLCRAWNHQMARGNSEFELVHQEVVLTVPASFDEVARTLTAEAARAAGFHHLTLLEEPLAAFYAWLSAHEKSWQLKLSLGATVLVCDVGGGTTDFSLIAVEGSAEAPILVRQAVGNHLLLGGDNMDNAIAHLLESRLFSEPPTSTQWMQLLYQARCAKEALLSRETEEFQVVLQGSGSSVVAGSCTAPLSYAELQKLLIGGFFPSLPWNEASVQRSASGIRTMGLPYEDEPAITNHLAHFLRHSNGKGGVAKPDFVLFNGGAMKPKIFQEAILHALKEWFPDKSPELLPSQSLDLAVARGAAYYGRVRRGDGVKIGGGLPRGYYIGFATAEGPQDVRTRALTLLPRGAQEEESYECNHVFQLQPNKPIAFKLYTSHVRLNDASGDIVEINGEEFQQLPPIHTLLRFGRRQQGDNAVTSIPVHLAVKLNAIGILELWLKAVNSPHTWELQFQLRTATGQDNSLSTLEERPADELLDTALVKRVQEALAGAFATPEASLLKKLFEILEAILEMPRRQWSPSLLRSMWEPLWQQANRRSSSHEHNCRWWNLAGFLLRPGTGFPLDDFRIKELWKILLANPISQQSPDCQLQQWICVRRIAAGLSRGQQMQMAQELYGHIFDKRGKIAIKGKGEEYRYSEKMRALASLELIDCSLKVKVATALVERIAASRALPVDFWALARLGARQMLYGSAANVVAAKICTSWVERLLAANLPADESLCQLLCQLTRKSDQRVANLPPELVDRVVAYFSDPQLRAQLEKPLLSVVPISLHEQEFLFGEQLPDGLLLDISSKV
jgi:molecular chaperone DnaK (HSP70)